MIVWVIFRSLEKSTKLSVSWYGVPVPNSRYLGKKLPIGDATFSRKKDDATVKIKPTIFIGGPRFRSLST